MDTRILKHGAPVRLFPVYPESCKEQRSISIVLAAMVSVRPFAEKILTPLGAKVGKRSLVSAFTEVTLVNEVKGLKDRPDALLVVETGKNSWSALIEAKIGKNSVESAQLERYIELAKLNNIDAVITITNELTPAPSIHPTQLAKSILRNQSLYHLSWSSILTIAFLLAAAKENPFDNDDEAYIVSELIRYLEHAGSGRLPLDQMNQGWPKIVSDVQAGHPINGRSEEVSDMITTWHQEARDIALIMTRKLKEAVTLAVTRNQIADREGWVESETKNFCEAKVLSFDLDVPNAASRIFVEADFLRRAVRVSMKLAAPADKVSNAAKLNWLLRQLQKSDLSHIIIRCVTRGKGQNFGAMAKDIDPKADEIKNLADIASFHVEMSCDLGAKFNSRKKFVEGIEELVPRYYMNVGQHLQAWVAPPPKLTKEMADDATENIEASPEASDSPISNSELRREQQERPDWAKAWQSEPTISDAEEVSPKYPAPPAQTPRSPG